MIREWKTRELGLHELGLHGAGAAWASQPRSRAVREAALRLGEDGLEVSDAPAGGLDAGAAASEAPSLRVMGGAGPLATDNQMKRFKQASSRLLIFRGREIMVVSCQMIAAPLKREGHFSAEMSP